MAYPKKLFLQQQKWLHASLTVREEIEFCLIVNNQK